MRFRFKPASEQRAALRMQLARLEQPATALEMVRSHLPNGFKPVEVLCTVQSTHPDRFVTQVQVRSNTGQICAYALKAYSDDFVEQVWLHSQALGQHRQPEYGGLCLAIGYVPEERLLVFPWVEGQFLSEIVDDRKPELLRLAARVAADLHRLPIVPEELTTPWMLFEETRARCDRLRLRCPDSTRIVEPLLAALQGALGSLDPADPASVHGDMAARQFLWTGDRLVLLDLDLFGYTDRAYDAGHFCAQLERRCLVDPTVESLASLWIDSFCDAYLDAMPTVSLRNVFFYRGLTLIRKIYTICRREPVRWPQLVPKLADRARAALHEVVSLELAG